MQTFTSEALGGLYFGQCKLEFEPVGDHVKVTVRGALYWGGAVPPPFVFPIWVKVYYKGNEIDRWESSYNPVRHPGPFFFVVDKMYDIPEGEEIRLVAGYSYLVWEFETDEKKIVIDYFSPYIGSCTFDVISTYEGILRIILASAYWPPSTDRAIMITIGRGDKRVWSRDYVWPAGKREISIELTCSKEKLPGYVYLPEGRYWVVVSYKGRGYDSKYVDVSYEYKTFWQRVVEWFYDHKYELLGLALVLVLIGAVMARRRRSS